MQMKMILIAASVGLMGASVSGCVSEGGGYGGGGYNTVVVHKTEMDRSHHRDRMDHRSDRDRHGRMSGHNGMDNHSSRDHHSSSNDHRRDCRPGSKDCHKGHM